MAPEFGRRHVGSGHAQSVQVVGRALLGGQGTHARGKPADAPGDEGKAWVEVDNSGYAWLRWRARRGGARIPIHIVRDAYYELWGRAFDREIARAKRAGERLSDQDIENRFGDPVAPEEVRRTRALLQDAVPRGVEGKLADGQWVVEWSVDPVAGELQALEGGKKRTQRLPLDVVLWAAEQFGQR